MRLLHSVTVNMALEKVPQGQRWLPAFWTLKVAKGTPIRGDQWRGWKNSHWKGPISSALCLLDSTQGSSFTARVRYEKPKIHHSDLNWKTKILEFPAVYLFSCIIVNQSNPDSDHLYKITLRFLHWWSREEIKRVLSQASNKLSL